MSFLTAEEWEGLPETGEIAPNRIRFSHDRILGRFKGQEGKCILRSVVTLKKERGVSPFALPAIRIVLYVDGWVYTLDNRRLWVYQKAGVNILYQKIAPIPEEQLNKFTTTNQGVSVIVKRPKYT